jgi:hypothetical protein
MQLFLLRRRAALFSLAILVVAPLTAAQPTKTAAPKGQSVFSCGHSFHMFMPPILSTIAKSAGIEDHRQAGASSIGGSYTHQHWAKEGPQAAKTLIPELKPDVLTLAPIYLPDDGIENFVKLCSEKSPTTRVLIQEFWLPFDVYNLNYKKEKMAAPNRDATDMAKLEADHQAYFKSMDGHVNELNAKYAGKPQVGIVPVGQAVLALRKAVVAGKAPGIAKQSELFTDPIGHCTNAIKVLNAYCHYAVIYGRSPVGLPVPTALAMKDVDAETTAKLNTLLQELAWDAVTSHPLTGVKK